MKIKQYRTPKDQMTLAICYVVFAILCTEATGQSLSVPRSDHSADLQSISQSCRTKSSLNYDWRFIKDDIDGAGKLAFDDSSWLTVSCPHTYNDIDTFDGWSPKRHRGEIDQWAGKTWYRKHFKLDDSQHDKKIFVEFEGVRQIAEVYINGHYLGMHKTGFTPFGFDLTEHVKFGGADNVLAVRCDNTFNDIINYAEGGQYGLPWNSPHWHPAHGGIYRNVYLHVTDKLHVTLPLYSFLETEGPYIYASSISSDSARVTVEAEVINEYSTSKDVVFNADIIDLDGNTVMTGKASYELTANQKYKFVITGTIAAPQRWEPAYPYLYVARMTLRTDGKVVDIHETSFGIRSPEWTIDKGFWINDRYVKLKGWGQKPTNEWAGLGSAFPEWMHDHTMKMMADAGANFIRWGHCAASPGNIAMADKYGLVTLQPGVDGEGDCQGEDWSVRAQALRDVIIYFRNNPSILIWEGGNQSISLEHVKELKAYIDRYDPHGQRAYAHRRANNVVTPFMHVGVSTEGSGYPKNLPAVEGEYNREESPRRVWDDFSPPDFDYVAGKGQTYDLTSEQFAVNQVKQYKKISPTSHCGGANWIFSDSTSGGRVNCEVARTSGEVDAVRLPKEAYYVCKAIFSDSPQVHVIGHWNYPKDTTKTMYAVSNCDRVELFVNGKSLGYGQRNDTYLFEFPKVKWQEGSVKAIAYNDGSAVASQEKKTAGKPHRVKLTSITGLTGLRATGSDVVLVDCEVVDKDGNRCPTFQGRIDFAMSGPGVWRGGYNSGKAKSTNNTWLDIEAGINRVAIRSTLTPGVINLRGEVNGIKVDEIEIVSHPVIINAGLSMELPPVSKQIKLTPPLDPVAPEWTLTSHDKTDELSGTLILDVSYSGPTQGCRVKTNLQNGDRIYTDRNYIFSDLPAYLADAEHIQLPNNDKRYSALDLIQFGAGTDAYIYVAHDDRLPEPTWLSSAFTATGDHILINNSSMSLFRKAIAKGGVLTLGGNTDGETPSACNLYIVFAVKK